jgi:hypothetical protein
VPPFLTAVVDEVDEVDGVDVAAGVLVAGVVAGFDDDFDELPHALRATTATTENVVASASRLRLFKTSSS